MQSEPRLVLASSNPAKLRRLRGLFTGLPLRLSTPGERGLRLNVPEHGLTHEENAASKAVAWSEAARGYAIASDGGLLLPGLGDRWNSLHTQRFAGPDATDADRGKTLLNVMSGLSSDARGAWWYEALALAYRGDLLACWAVCSGQGVIDPSFDPQDMEPGFWVASLWSFPLIGKTYRQASASDLAAVGEPWSRLRTIAAPAVRRWLHAARWAPIV